MQKFIVKEVKPSTGEKSPTIINTEDGSKLSGFHSSLKTLTPGTEFEAEIEIKKGYTNIVGEVKILSASPVVKSNGYDMSKEDWEKKNRIERESIEAQSARSAIFGLYPLIMNGDYSEEESNTISRIMDKALNYTEQCLDRVLSPQPAKSKSNPVKQQDNNSIGEIVGPPFKDSGDFWSKAHRKWGKTQSEFCVILSINKPSDINDFDWAWMEIEKNLTSD